LGEVPFFYTGSTTLFIEAEQMGCEAVVDSLMEDSEFLANVRRNLGYYSH
jgi:hypothetical protein|tara:strand:- start:103 stop:252 length:150 start_codon:yes stop_codon:yes gene_type:complete